MHGRSRAARLWARAAGVAGLLGLLALADMLLGGFFPPAEAIDPFVLAVVLVGVRGDSLRGLAAGLLAGLTQDVVTSSPLGLHGVACCVVGYGAALVSRRILASRRVVTLAIVATGVLVHHVVVIGLLAVFEIAPFQPATTVVMLRMAWTTAAGLVVLWVTALVRFLTERRVRRRTLAAGRAGRLR